MRNSTTFTNSGLKGLDLGRLKEAGTRMPRQFVIGTILILALFAFEMFNFDTTRYALETLLGDVRFAGLAWATILAVAFCAIDFAGLARLFTPERGLDEPKEIWYLTGAWLLGASMNAVMTWWAVSMVLLNHELGNEVLSREQLLKIVPVFVAILVWLTRILFIGAVTIAGERLLYGRDSEGPRSKPASRPIDRTKNGARPQYVQETPAASPTNGYRESVDLASPPPSSATSNKRVRQRPPRPANSASGRVPYKGAGAARRSARRGR